jgi:Ca-activated chloride channel homolog
MSRAGLPIQVLDRKGEIPKTLTAQDFSVTEDGVSRPVAGVAPVTQPWRVVIYVDRILTGSRTMRAAAGVLAERARELAALGTVEIVVAEPEPGVILSPTREPRAIDEVLSRLWLSGEGRDDLSSLRRRFLEERAAAGEEGLTPEEIAEAVEAETRLVRRQQEGLAEWLSSRSGDGPQLLLLVTDGYERNPAAFYSLKTDGDGSLERTALETARTAAALGWTVLPLPVGGANLPDLRVRPGGPRNAPIGGTITLGGKKKDEKKPAPPPPPVLTKAAEPLEWMAEASGGSLILLPQDIPAALAGIRSRLWLTYETPREADGKPHAVEVRTLRPDVALTRARRWEGAGLPETVSAARARRVLDGEEETGSLEISARIQTEGSLDLRVESPEVEGPLRLTVASGPDGAATHRLLSASDLTGAEPGVYRVPFTPPPGAETLGVLVETLDDGGWGGAVVTLGPAEDPAVSVDRPFLRLVIPDGDELAGRIHVQVAGGGPGVSRVDLLLGDRKAASCASLPCEAEVDLGRRVRPQLLRAVAYGIDGHELARDSIGVNDPEEAFRVRIVEPASGRGAGSVEVEADVRAPAGRRVEKVEMFWNDELADTVYAPPYRGRVRVPRQSPVGYLRVAARLDDGTTAEDALALNASALGDRIDVRLVQLAVVVTDPTGKPVPGLPKDAFRLRQDGRDQEISAFENAGELPLTLALAIDSSASMFLKLPDVRNAVTSLLDTGLTERDRAMLIDFDSEPRMVQPVTRELAAVTSSLRLLNADGKTALWDAVTFSLGQLRRINGRKALVVYSDGIDEGSHSSFSSSLNAARESRIPIYLIVANPRAARKEDGGFLSEPSANKFQRLAEAGGGQVYFIERDQNLSGVYQQILSELRSQYTLGFYPEDTAAGRGRIEVDVVGRKGLTARTMSGLPGAEASRR